MCVALTKEFRICLKFTKEIDEAKRVLRKDLREFSTIVINNMEKLNN